jgi:general L-amino acid transport system substrate-binding protein
MGKVAARRASRAAVSILFAAIFAGPATAATLDTVKQRGKLICGVNQGLPGFSAPGDDGTWAGFDVDFCKAVAAAVFGDAGKVEYFPVTAANRFDLLKAGDIDVLSRNSTWTMSREVALGANFVGTTYYDGQGFMVPADKGALSALELGGSKVCVQSGTTTEANLADYFNANNMAYEAVLAASPAEALAAYAEGKCNVMTSDMSQLYALRLTLTDPGAHVVLPDAISKEPLGPAVRVDDPKWAQLVKWVYFALLNAEELGVDSETLGTALTSTRPEVRRLVGLDGTFGTDLGIANDWVVAIIKAVGNYSEVYERNLGVNSKLGIPRGMNQLWSLGGIQYAPPIR